MSPKRPDNVFQFLLWLEDIEPRIWRRIQVPDSLTLEQLHRVIQIVFGWQDSHLHEFTFGGDRYGEPDSEDDGNLIDERTIRLRDMSLRVGRSMSYVYDFGDYWQHQLTLEKAEPLDSVAVYPTCIGGERSTPPEDVGGTGGYEEFLEAIGDPTHEEHDAMLQWVGGHFDPEAFSMAEANHRLRQLSRRRRKQ